MLTTFNQTIQQADDRFLSDSELHALEAYVQSFAVRQQTYQLLSQHADELVIGALRQFAQTHRKDVEADGAKCKRDMAYALKYIARAALMDEADAFKQDFALWMENITRAVHKGDAAAKAYGCLNQVIQAKLPNQCAAIVTPYLEDLIMAFSG